MVSTLPRGLNSKLPVTLRILHFPAWFSTPQMPGNGIFIKRHIACLPSPCISASVFVFPDANDSLISEKIHDRYLAITVAYKKSSNPLLKCWRLFSAYRKGIAEALLYLGNPDVLHLHVLQKKQCIPLYLFRNFKGKIVFSEQWSGYFPADGRLKGSLYDALINYMNKRIQHFTAVSSALAAAMIEKGIRGPVSVIPNVTADVFYRKHEKTKPSNRFRFIHVSALNDFEKNVSGIIKAFAKASAGNPGMELVLAGDSDMLADYRRLSSDLKIDNNVSFTGFLPAEKLALELNKADCFVMFSFFETFSCATAEALAAGIPCIVSDGGALPELINEKNGLVVPVGDIDALANVMVEMSKNHGKYRAEDISRSIAEKTNANNVGAGFIQVYTS